MEEAGAIVQGMTSLAVPIVAAVNGPAVASQLHSALASETASFDEAAFQPNLEKMLAAQSGLLT